MIGRVYRWRGRAWRVIARWAPPARERTFAADDGRIFFTTARAVYSPYPHQARAVGHGAGPRNVLIQDVETGQLVVRPFRGLRKMAQGP